VAESNQQTKPYAGRQKCICDKEKSVCGLVFIILFGVAKNDESSIGQYIRY